MNIKVAHSVIVTPGHSGLYETTRELVASLRVMGVDSRLVDPDIADKFNGYKGDSDRGVPIADWDWAVDADVVVSHSGYEGSPCGKTDQPVILCCHGRPYNSMMIEGEGGAAIYSFMYNKNADDRIKAVVTFWSEHVDFHRVMFPDKPVFCVQSPVDLVEWCDGPAKYQFNGKGGNLNVVCTETWRQDGGPWMPLNVFALWARDNPGTKLHLYAVPKNRGGYQAILKRVEADGNLGEVLGWVHKGMREIYRSADAVLVGNDIDTRTVREAAACGCQVFKVSNWPDRFPRRTREQVRRSAEKRFNPTVSAMQFKQILGRL